MRKENYFFGNLIFKASAFSSMSTSNVFPSLRFSLAATSFNKAFDSSDNRNADIFLGADLAIMIYCFITKRLNFVYTFRTLKLYRQRYKDMTLSIRLFYCLKSKVLHMGYMQRFVYGTGYCRNCKEEFLKELHTTKYCSSKCYSDYRKGKDAFRNIWYFRILERDGFSCFYCGRTPQEDRVKLCLDHLYPLSKGGDTDLNNIVSCCEECNSKKADLVFDRETMNRFYKAIAKRNEDFSKEDYDKIIKRLKIHFASR